MTAIPEPISQTISSPLEHGDLRNHDHSRPPRIEAQDGGWKAWSTVVGSFFALFVTFGTVNTFGIFQSYYRNNLLTPYSNSALSWIGSIQLFVLYATALPLGKLFDAGYTHWMLLIGTVVYTAGVFSLSICRSFYSIFLTQGLTVAIGLSLIFFPSQAITSHWFKRRRAIAMGIVACGSSFGGVVFPIMLKRLLVATSFANTVRAFAAVNLVCLIVANLCIKTMFPIRKLSEVHLTERKVFHDAQFLLLTGCSFLVFWGLYLPIFYLTVFGETHHLSDDVSFYSLSMLNGASIIGRIIPGYMADRVGPLAIFTPCCGICGILIFVWIVCTKQYSFIIFAIFYGIFSGAFISLIPVVVTSFTPDVRNIGVRLGNLLVIISFAGLSGTPIMGAILQSAASDTDSGFWAPETFASTSVLLGSIGLLVLTLKRCQKTG